MKTLTVTRLLILVACLLAPQLASAQAIDGYRLNIYNQGAAPTATPIQSFDFANAAITCNLAPPTVTPGTPVNPTRALWDDPTNAGRVCQWQDPGTGPLFSVPFGAAYEAGLQAYNVAGRGPESNRVPFSRLAPPTNAPTGLRVIRPGS
jgi:hypothetical protein